MSWILIISAATAIGCGLISGFFLTFSDFLMRSLRLSKPSAGIEAMQIINVEVWKSIFIVLLWGFVAITTGLGIYAYFNLTGPALPYILTGSGSYIIGVLGVSYLFNIPMNDRLAALNVLELSTRRSRRWYCHLLSYCPHTAGLTPS